MSFFTCNYIFVNIQKIQASKTQFLVIEKIKKVQLKKSIKKIAAEI